MTLFQVNQRFFDVQYEPHETLLPIEGYEDMPLLSLKMAVKNLESKISKVVQNAHIATERSESPNDGLTQDESAAIYLYTMHSKSNDQSLCAKLNVALRSKDRSQLFPYFFYLKLFLSALWKLKSMKTTVWRGVKGDLSDQYPLGKNVIWWGFSSCVESFEEIQSDKFLGKSGIRTLFQIECESGKAISGHSYYHDIDEILLLPGIQLRVIEQINSGNGLYIIRLKEIKTSFSLLQSPFTPTTVDSPIKRTEKKANSATTFSSTHCAANVTVAQRSQSFSVLTSPSISKTQTNVSKKPSKLHENKQLKELIKQGRKEQSFRFSEQMPNYDDIEIIADELTSNKSWTIMYLWKNSMNERHMTILMRGLKMNSTVMCLNLDHNLLGDDGVCVLARALKFNTSIQSLYLNSNRITDIGAEQLAGMLKLNETLTHLELSSNAISDNGIATICNALKVNKYLRTICLNDNEISGIGAEHLGNMLKVNKTLTHLELSSNPMGDDGVNAIVDSLQQNVTLESIHLGETMISTNSMHNIKEMIEMNEMLKCLYLNKNNLGDDALMILIPALMENETLTSIDLSMNNLSDRSAKEIGCLLKQKQTTLTTLNISGNPIGDEGIASIARALSKNRTVQKLMIDSVNMTIEGVNALANMLCSNVELRYLSINDNAIDDDSMKLLADALKSNRSLQYLYLNNCELRDECVPLIKDIIQQNTTLISIELVKNHITEQGKVEIRKANMLNKTCSIYLDFTFH